jgi:hypothetical protein
MHQQGGRVRNRSGGEIGGESDPGHGGGDLRLDTGPGQRRITGQAQHQAGLGGLAGQAPALGLRPAGRGCVGRQPRRQFPLRFHARGRGPDPLGKGLRPPEHGGAAGLQIVVQRTPHLGGQGIEMRDQHHLALAQGLGEHAIEAGQRGTLGLGQGEGDDAGGGLGETRGVPGLQHHHPGLDHLIAGQVGVSPARRQGQRGQQQQGVTGRPLPHCHVRCEDLRFISREHDKTCTHTAPAAKAIGSTRLR